MRKLIAVLLLLAVAACGKEPDAAAVVADPKQPYVVHEWPIPAQAHSGQPDLASAPDGRVLLTWISRLPGRRPALMYVGMADNGHWYSSARSVVVGESLMASWANVPHIAQTPDGALWIQFMQQRGEGHAGDIALARSSDGGFNWSTPIAVNDTSIMAEHGFAALWPVGRDRIGVAWLAGPPMEDGADTGEGMHHGHGSTQLRATTFDLNLQRSDDTVLDTMTCDCCQSELAMTTQGPVLAYRDRTAAEVRDIVVVRKTAEGWSEPVLVHPDNWVMAGCPVNGPAIASHGDNVVVAWFTAADDKPLVQVARSTDAGASFRPPVVLEQGNAVQGRTAVAVDETQAWILWIREDAGGQSLWPSRRTPDLSTELQRLEVAKLQGRGRATGYPQIVLRDGVAHIAWTDIVDGVPRLRGAIVSP
jgi:hypothetical protein